MKEEARQFSCPMDVPEWFGAHQRHERRDAAEHRQRILEVAQRLFIEQGVDAVSMHQIALTAGIGQGTLYRRYRHKGELCMDLMRENHERFVEEVTELFAAKQNAPSLERLDDVLLKMVALLEDQGALSGPIAETMIRDARCNEVERSPRFSFRQSPWYLWLHGLLTRLLTEAVEREELVSLDASFTADAIIALLNPLFYHFQRQERGLSSERILQGIRRIYSAASNLPSGDHANELLPKTIGRASQKSRATFDKPSNY